MTAQIAMPGVGVWVTVRATGQVGRVTALAGPPNNPTLASVNFGNTFGMYTAAELDTVDIRYQKPYSPPYTGKELTGVTIAWSVWGLSLLGLIGFVVVCVGLAWPD